MIYLYVLAIVLHVATAASWLGLSLRLPELAKRIVASDGAVADALGASGSETVEMMNRYAVLMYALALAAILLGPGF
ncbi:MAG: hypothetical protein R3284_10445, partial [Rubricoccaceae bacterium]|nr:hypothetical protein [Rubricoccaceae bacterium]